MDPRLTEVPLGGQVLCWDAGSGRGFRIDADADPRALDVRIARLGLDADRSAWVPHRSRATLTLPEERTIWGALPFERTAGGHRYRAWALAPLSWEVWARMDGRRSVARIADELGVPSADVLAVLRELGAADRQAMQLWPGAVPASRLRHIERPDRPPNARTADQYGPDGGTTLGAYHDRIDAHDQFDARETTVAHALALGHPGLGGRPYGQALRGALRARGFAVDGPVVEVGCGTGELAASWGADASYLRVDRSPALLDAQRTLVPHGPGVLGDALDLPIADASVRCLVSNEVLADLPSTPGPSGWDNTGARRMVDEVARVLAPGGRAVLTEFGVLDGPVEEARQLDHPEVAIAFGPLAAHARTRRLDAEVLPLEELLGLDLHAPQLARLSWHALRSLCHARGVAIPTRAWTPDSLPALPWPVEGLDWTTLADEGPGPLVTRFHALLLHRPEDDHA